jgi:predicted ATPase
MVALCMAGKVLMAGRVHELQAVSAMLAGESGAAAMLVVGEAGIGKSRLVAAASSSDICADVVVLSGWCLRFSEGLPFLPVADVLRALSDVEVIGVAGSRNNSAICAARR